VPAELGGPQDLNFDGDAQDNLTAVGSSVDLKLVPMTITVTFGDGSPQQTIVAHRLIGKTTD
jgi:hypothetical protein